MRFMTTALVLLTLVLMISACTGSTSENGPGPSATPAAETVTQTVALAAPCTDPHAGACRGPLAAGTFITTYFEPRFAYTVPEGWENADDDLDTFVLRPTGIEGMSINVFRDVSAAAQDQACSERPAPGVGGSAEDLASWTAEHRGLDAPAPDPVTVGGLDGFVLAEVTLTPGWDRTCPFSEGAPSVPLVWGGRDGHLHWVIGGEDRIRIYALDVPGGGTIWIDIEVAGGTGFNELVVEADTIVRSLTFATG